MTTPARIKNIKEQNSLLQLYQLHQWQTNKQCLSIYLINGIRLEGYIAYFSQYTIALHLTLRLKAGAHTCLLYKSKIASLMPIPDTGTVKLTS